MTKHLKELKATPTAPIRWECRALAEPTRGDLRTVVVTKRLFYDAREEACRIFGLESSQVECVPIDEL